MNFGFGSGGSVSQHHFNLDHVFNTPNILGDGTFIRQGYIGTGGSDQSTMGEADGGWLSQSSTFKPSFIPKGMLLNLQAVP